jgi:hypothetical protein
MVSGSVLDPDPGSVRFGANGSGSVIFWTFPSSSKKVRNFLICTVL